MTIFTNTTARASLAAAYLCCVSHTANAHNGLNHEDKTKAPQHASTHAPIGVMADHRHKKGEFMFSLRAMNMHMDGNRTGTDTISADQIVQQTPNIFFGQPMQPPTVRITPNTMDMDMVMAGVMYGISNRLTIMAMGGYGKKSMDHMTYQGMMGTNTIGNFTTKTDGFTDTNLTLIMGLEEWIATEANPIDERTQFNLNLGVSLPTGTRHQTGQVLTPMNTTPSPRLPYAMQLGTGTFDLKPAFTFQTSGKGTAQKWGYGAQISAQIPLGKNGDGYRYGNRANATAWVSYEPANWISLSGRIAAKTQGQIKGQDTLILAPVQTANPAFYGGEQVDALFGINLVGQKNTLGGAAHGQRLAIELSLPVYRNLNGVQLKTDHSIMIGWQKAF